MGITGLSLVVLKAGAVGVGKIRDFGSSNPGSHLSYFQALQTCCWLQMCVRGSFLGFSYEFSLLCSSTHFFLILAYVQPTCTSLVGEAAHKCNTITFQANILCLPAYTFPTPKGIPARACCPINQATSSLMVATES
jgi:hypothetical protein